MKHYTLQISGILGEGVCDTAKVGVNPKTKYIYSQYNWYQVLILVLLTFEGSLCRGEQSENI